MRYFVVFISRIAADAEDLDLAARHQAFVEDGIASGRILLASPSSHGGGSLLLVSAASQADLAAYLESSPFWTTGLTELDIQEVSPNGLPNSLDKILNPSGIFDFSSMDGDGYAFV